MSKPLTRNEHWLLPSRTAVWHPCTQMKQHETTPLVPISRGSGSWLYDSDGHRYLDCLTRDEMEILASRTLEIVACA
jgi:adenosylmethionine-8-amino-7-oxononanoate aminotransferase